MSVSYTGIGWNRQKRIYDSILVAGLVLCGGIFAGLTLMANPESTIETIIIRTSAILAFLLLHVILCIGPLARLESRFLSLLYNRRHLGVAMCVLALVHGVFAIIQFHALGNTNPIVSVFTAYSRDYRPGHGFAHFPFEPIGFLALIILFLMAATSHDFWLKNLGPSIWKSLHLGVYIAYGLIIAHVALGALQYERSTVYPMLLGLGFIVVCGLHMTAFLKENGVDKQRARAESDGYVPACMVREVPDGRGKVVIIAGQRVALFRHNDRIFATSNACRHQGGPLGEGRILDGCITCPWHGWQYNPDNGASPPPFAEVVPTFNAKVIGSQVYVHPNANPLRQACPGAPCNPANSQGKNS